MPYGVNDMRDGVNLSRMQVTRPLVMHTEVTNLPNLMGYLRFGRSLPVVRFEDSYNKVASVAEAFEERTTTPIRLAGPVVEFPPAPLASSSPTRPKSSPPKRRRAGSEEQPAELPLPQPHEPPTAPVDASSESPMPPPADPPGGGEQQAPRPRLELFGKHAGFRLEQHGRRDGARNKARPA